jgi:hypothetical protein
VKVGSPESPRAVLPPAKDLDHVRQGFAEAERGEGIVLTPEELARWAATGEWPWESGQSRA